MSGHRDVSSVRLEVANARRKSIDHGDRFLASAAFLVQVPRCDFGHRGIDCPLGDGLVKRFTAGRSQVESESAGCARNLKWYATALVTARITQSAFRMRLATSLTEDRFNLAGLTASSARRWATMCSHGLPVSTHFGSGVAAISRSSPRAATGKEPLMA